MSTHTTDVYWRPGTVYKTVFKFSELRDGNGTLLGLEDFTAYSSNCVDGYSNIIELTVDRTDGDTSDVPLGIVESSTANVQIYDIQRRLDLDYAGSPYKSALIQGIKVYMYIATKAYRDETPGTDSYYKWEDYGTWYTTGFSGSFSDGGFDVVNVQLEDRVNVLGVKEIEFSDNDALQFAGINMIDLLKNVFATMGVGTDEYEIDSNLQDINLQYGIMSGTRFRDFLNNVCQMLIAKVRIDVHGILHVEPALKAGSEVWELELQNEMTSTTNSNSLYNSVVVDYYGISDCSYDRITSATQDLKFDTSIITPDSGKNVISLPFTNTAMSVCGVTVGKSTYADEMGLYGTANVESIKWGAWQDGITMEIYVDGEIKDASIKVDGIVASKEPRKSRAYLIDEGVQSEATMVYHFDSKQMISSESADTLASYIATYMKKMRNTKSMSGTVYTPLMSVGDTIKIVNSTSAYNGIYRLTAINMRTGSDYSLGITIIKLSDLEDDDNE